MTPPVPPAAAAGAAPGTADGRPRLLRTTAPTGPSAVWRPIAEAGRIVDFALHAVDDGAEHLLSLPAGVALGERMTALFPDSTIDGRLPAFRAVVETGRPFRLTRPSTPTRPEVSLAVSRTPAGDVVVELEPDVARPTSPSPARDARRWQRLFDDTVLGIGVVTLDGCVLEANRVLLAMLDRPAEEVLSTRFDAFAAPDDTTRLDRERLLRTGHATMEKRYRRGDGRELWLRVAASVVVEDGEHRILSICEDVTEARRARAQLAHRADHDPLTGLPNRERLRRRLRALLEDVRGGLVEGAGLLFLDLDRFKVINDSLGHAAGDRLLREVATRLLRSTPPDDLLARLGGDEFALVTRDHSGAVALAQRLVAVLEAPFALDGREVTVGASIGVSVREGVDPASPDLADEDALLREADTAMYAAKRSGEGPVVVFEETLRRRAVARLEDEQGLRRALQRDELRVHYQPIVRSGDLGLSGFEALVRWQHPDRGLLGPGAFLPTAEETGLVVPLGQHVLREACAALAAWHGTGAAGRMSVNVSAQHLAAGSLGDDVARALEASGLQPQDLVLEITEQALVVSHEKAAAVLGELRDRGCQVALDDFGTGYSSLAYLRQLPVDVLKIDRTFVTGAAADSDDGRLLSAITALGASLGLRTVVEGVETEAELRAARTAGASHVQGSLLGRPAGEPTAPPA
jgi:diguanylate cyclase (GGDEF)-like protein/PAS domain S-box-containing protein